MIKFLRIAAIAVPVALVAPSSAQANPMVAVGWVVAAGVGGVILGALAANSAYARPVVATQYPTVQPVDYNCESVKVRYQGRWHRAQICD